MVAERVSIADLAAHLTEVLERVRDGRHVAIERDGEVIATIAPPAMLPTVQPGVTLRELAAVLARLPPVDDDFGPDIEAMRAMLLPSKVPEWSD